MARSAEGRYQDSLIDRIEAAFPNAVVLKTDPSYIQGFPDLLVLLGDKWVAAEVKKSKDEPYQPNQPWWLSYLDSLGSAVRVDPSCEDAFFDLLTEVAS